MAKSYSKRLRLFAGPNGSGKTTIIKNFPKKIPLGVYVNADDIEKALKESGQIDLSQYKISAKTAELRDYISTSGVSFYKAGKNYTGSDFRIIKDKIRFNKSIPIDSYIAADIAGFIRQGLIAKGISFSFETVLSHPSKIDLLKQARQNSYRIYLYYVATDSPIININRVAIRVAKKGHPVDDKIIEKRYYRSLDILLDVIKLSNRAYLFDNSGKYYELVAEITEGKKVDILDLDKDIPEWFMTYVYDKIQT